MNKFLLLVTILFFISCGNKKKEADKNSSKSDATAAANALPIEKYSSIAIDTFLVRKLPKKEMNAKFNTNRQIQLGISNELYQAYSYNDKSGVYYFLLTDHVKNVNEKKDTLYDNVYAMSVRVDNNKFKKRSTIKGEIDDQWETSIGFWNQYSQLFDYDGDGSVDPIIVYGTTTDNNYVDGRVRILAYHNKSRITIKHQNSEIADGRITKINKKLYTFPASIQEAVKETMRKMVKNGHAVFADDWEKSMENQAIRLGN